MSLSPWDEGSDSDHATGLNLDSRLAGHCRISVWQRTKLPGYRSEGAVEVRPFTAERRPRVSEAQVLSGEAVKGNPTMTVIPRVDESKSSPRPTEDLTEPVETNRILTMNLGYLEDRFGMVCRDVIEHSRLDREKMLLSDEYLPRHTTKGTRV